MVPLIMGLGPQELIIILVIVLLLFGGSRLAGLGKSSGRALKEFKEETRGLRDNKDATTTPTSAPPVVPPQQAINPQGAPSPYTPMPPNNLADPSATDVRKDV